MNTKQAEYRSDLAELMRDIADRNAEAADRQAEAADRQAEFANRFATAAERMAQNRWWQTAILVAVIGLAVTFLAALPALIQYLNG